MALPFQSMNWSNPDPRLPFGGTKNFKVMEVSSPRNGMMEIIIGRLSNIK